jgi:hypothetical protein
MFKLKEGGKNLSIVSSISHQQNKLPKKKESLSSITKAKRTIFKLKCMVIVYVIYSKKEITL